MPTVKQPELLTFILHKHLKCYIKTDKCFKYYKTPSNGIQSGQIQYPNKWSTLSFYTKNALAKRISVRVTIQHTWIWSLKCNRDFHRGAKTKTLNTASEERMIYMKEKHKQTEVGGILQRQNENNIKLGQITRRVT